MDICRALGLIILLLTGCSEHASNHPYPDAPADSNTLYTAFSEQPKHLDPARSYSSNEWIITNQIYEPPLQYHYLKRPYTLTPLVATQMPAVTYTNTAGHEVPAGSTEIAYSHYRVHIAPGIHYQPHPAFAQDEGGFLYHDISQTDARRLTDFPVQATRELVAQDFVYQIKRLASPQTQSPIFGFMSEYVVGLTALREDLNTRNEDKQAFLDLRQVPFEGARVIDKYTYEIKLKGQYPQFTYWLAMPFFAPMPWEADKFYHQAVLIEKNITLDWYPVGTGPYMLSENNPNYRMQLERNPHYHGELYPSVGMPEDASMGLLTRQGQPLPFIDTVVFSLEKENIPYWNKFLQGYYDSSGISSDSFDQALQSGEGGLDLSDDLRDQGIHLETSPQPTIFYWGFNMHDSVVGGYTDEARALRQAIAIAIDEEAFIEIFLNGRATMAHSPIPPGIAGHTLAPYNPFIYDWVDGQARRKNLAEAKALLVKAGYPNGQDPKTNAPLTLYLDDVSGGGPDTKAQFTWVQKQFEKLGINLVIRATQYNRFQEKMKNGQAQIFKWGWHADYPDPENFLFLLYGPNAKALTGGENAANYENPAFDADFQLMKTMAPGPARDAVIARMLAQVQEDMPWMPRFFPTAYRLSHQWMAPNKPNAMSRNTVKYQALDAPLRARLRAKWNQPIWWPLGLVILTIVALLLPGLYYYHRRTYRRPPMVGED